MQKIDGLKQLLGQQQTPLSIKTFATRLMDDLANCHCLIYGKDPHRILAQLALISDSLHYETFDKRIDLSVEGKIIIADDLPLHYCLQGNQFAAKGRCSILPRVCGVDLYLNHYNENKGMIRQNFSFSVKKLFQQR